MLPAFLTTILFSLSAVSGNISSRLVGGTNANFLRLLFATFVLAVVAHGWGGGLTGQALWWFMLSGIVGFGFGDAALFQALPRIGSRLSVVLVLCVSAPVAALMEWLWIGTRLSATEMICGAVILAGVALALVPGAGTVGSIREFWVGTTFGLFASLGQAGGAVLSRKAFALAEVAGENIDGLTAAYQRIVGGLAVTVLMVAVIRRRQMFAWAKPGSDPGKRKASRPNHWREAMPWILFNGLAGPALGVSCYQWALKVAPTGVVLPIVALTPVVIIPFSRFIEGERPTRRSLLGGLLAVLGAVALAYLGSGG